jgi:mannose-6-phosphate isomerase-like protein (cupin superfamily)
MSFFRATDTGTILLGPGDVYTFLATQAETDGAYFVMSGMVPPDAGPPPHIHHNQVETFYIVEGQLGIMLGDEVYEAKAGDFVHVSIGTPHRFINRSQTPAKIIVTFVPAGDIEDFFREAFEETTDRHATPPPLDDALIQRLLKAAEHHDIEILPPPEG